MEKNKSDFYIVSGDILPIAIRKTALAKEMLRRGEVSSILEAVDTLNMARSSFYKYKDGVFPFFDSSVLSILNISLLLENIPGVLSKVLNHIAEHRGNVLTINQSIPTQGTAFVTLSVSMDELTTVPLELISSLKRQEGVHQVQIIGVG